jgi:hypothetical protein
MLRACVAELLRIRMRAVATGSAATCQHLIVSLPSFVYNSYQRRRFVHCCTHRISSVIKEAFTARTPFNTRALRQLSTAAASSTQAAASQDWTTVTGAGSSSSRAAGSAAQPLTETPKRRRRRPIASAIATEAHMEQQQQQPLLMSPEGQQQLLDAVKDKPPVIFYHYPCADGKPPKQPSFTGLSQH